ncbi:MAG: hypothetical protein RL226_724 [Bacteroidota bacterium]|jgi:cytochrome c peroxidase
MILRILFTGALALFSSWGVHHAPTPYPFPELRFFPDMPQPLHNPVTVEGADLGRYLFYDPILSETGSLSCASCHKQEHAFADTPRAFSRGHEGAATKRNAMPLFNLAWYNLYFWDGRARSLEEQVFHPVRDPNEMHSDWTSVAERVRKRAFYREKFKAAFGHEPIDSVTISRAIGQFLRTLISNQSKYDRVLAGQERFTDDEYAGFVLVNDMTKGDCLHCHTTDANALGTTGVFSNNGLDAVERTSEFTDQGLGAITGQEEDRGKFKIPSLRNVAVTAPYMHDGRFRTLEEVLNFYSEGVQRSPTIDSKMGRVHQGGVRLTEREKEQIIAFLYTLTDSVFLANPNFGNPFR